MRNDFDPNEGFAKSGLPLDDDAIWSQLSAYADGEVTPEEAAAVEILLRADPALSRDFMLIRRAGDAARTLPEIEPPVGLRQAIFAATIQRQTPGDRLAAAWKRLRIALAPPPRRLGLAVGAVAAVCLASLLLPLARQGSGTHSPANSLAVKAGPDLPRQIGPAIPPHTSGSGPVIALNTESKPVAPNHVRRTVESRPAALLTFHRYRPTHIEVAVVSRPAKAVVAVAPGTHRLRKHGGTLRPPVEVAEYYPTPNMDQRNQHLTASVGASLAAHRDSDVPGKDLDAAEDAAAMPTAAVSAPAPSPAIPTLDPPAASHSTVRIARVSQLPPSTFVVPTAELRRQMEARNLNFNTATMEGLQRREATLTLINTHF